MGKRVMVVAFAAMAFVVMWSTDAVAQKQCLQYRTVGGSSICTKWSTKGVLLELTFKQNCGPSGTNCSAEATAEAAAGDSIAFCQSGGPTGPIVRRTCGLPVSFSATVTQCEGKHEQDGTGTGGEGHDKGLHGCTATVELARASCDACCNAGETCLDVTPFEMQTLVSATVGTGEGGGDLSLTQSDVVPAQSEEPAAGCTVFGEGSPICVYGERCTINPKKIELNGIRPYQCNLECVGSECLFSD
jgi:hypothetical protein